MPRAGLTLAIVASLLPLHSSPATASVTPVLLRMVEGATIQERFGESVDAFDLNGDGVPDFIVGAPGSVGVGAAFVYSGSDGTLLLSVPGRPTGASFGIEVKRVGDTDADGFPDFLVAELGEHRATLISGADGSARLGDVLLPYQTGIDAGMSMDAVGDVDRDGHADFAIAWRSAFGQQPSAAAIFSGANGDVLAGLVGEEPFDGSLSALEDASGDGIPEVAAGHFGFTTTYSGATGAALFRVEVADVLGSADVDGDGRGDLLVGVPVAPHDAAILAFSGSSGAFLYRVAVASQPECGTSGSCYLRIAIAGLGDVDDDGREEFAASLATASPGSLAEAGTVCVFSGASGERLAEIHGQVAGAHLGWSLSGPGDVDGDGTPI